MNTVVLDRYPVSAPLVASVSNVIGTALFSSVVHRGFQPPIGSNQIDMCCFPAKHAVLRSKNIYCLTRTNGGLLYNLMQFDCTHTCT
jgi:hypothetical protein